MNAALPTSAAARFDIMDLAQAMRVSNALDAVPLNLTDAQWVVLGDYLQPVSLGQGQPLIEQGVKDRTVYFVESGSLTVHYEDHKERMRIAAQVARRGIVRSFQISATFPNLTVLENVRIALQRATGLSMHFWRSERTLVRLDLCVAMSAVMARRMYHRPKRVAVT